jgi:hypothetical protein
MSGFARGGRGLSQGPPNRAGSVTHSPETRLFRGRDEGVPLTPARLGGPCATRPVSIEPLMNSPS